MVMTAQFSLPLDEMVAEVQRKFMVNGEAILRKISLDLYAEIIKRTPVDTGRARANWNYSLNSPDTSVSSNRSTSAVNVTAIEFKGLPTVYISNGLDYVRELEHGKSDQAPQGFIKLSIEAIRARGLT